jgi:hypothetical protein
MPNPAKPIERKRKLGNPGNQKLPPVVVIAEPVTEIPTPLRQLGRFGLEAWESIWTAGAHWIHGSTDIRIVQILCEAEDERAQLRHRVLTDQDWHDRNGLRSLEEFIIRIYSMLGFSPVDRGKMGVGEVRTLNVLDELRAMRERR